MSWAKSRTELRTQRWSLAYSRDWRATPCWGVRWGREWGEVTLERGKGQVIKGLLSLFQSWDFILKAVGAGEGSRGLCYPEVSGRTRRSHVWLGSTTLEPAVWGRAGGEWTGGRVQWVKLLLSPWGPEYGWHHPELQQEQWRGVDQLQTCWKGEPPGLCVCMLVTQLCPTLCDPMDCSRPGKQQDLVSD